MTFTKIGFVLKKVREATEHRMIKFEHEPSFSDEVIRIHRSQLRPSTCFRVFHIPTGYTAIITIIIAPTRIVDIVCYDRHQYAVSKRDAHYIGMIANAFMRAVGTLA